MTLKELQEMAAPIGMTIHVTSATDRLQYVRAMDAQGEVCTGIVFKHGVSMNLMAEVQTYLKGYRAGLHAAKDMVSA